MKIARFAFLSMLSWSVLSTAFLSCNNANKDDNQRLRGKFVNQTYLQQIPDSIPGLVNIYCYEMDFVSNDSVKILYGLEEATLVYKKNGLHFKIIKALRDKDLLFQINADSTLTLSDSIWNDSPTNSILSKSTLKGESWDFEYYLNKKMVAGTYEL